MLVEIDGKVNNFLPKSQKMKEIYGKRIPDRVFYLIDIKSGFE